MSHRKVTVNILECFVMWCALMAVCTQARVLERIRTHHRHHHHHHHHPNHERRDTELESSATKRQDTLVLLDDELPNGHQRERESTDNDSNTDSDSFVEESLNLGQLENQMPALQPLPYSLRASHNLRKRHHDASEHVSYAMMSEADRLSFEKDRIRVYHHKASIESTRNEHWQVDVKEAQNNAICNYTVIDIPDTSSDQSRIPKNLVNVMCNHAGSRCKQVGIFCCIQLYSKIDVSYSNGITENIKIFTGCVCSKHLMEQGKRSKTHHRIDD